jgi:alpha-1,4-digalacturonate transport system substrate-binding protein
MPRKRPRREQFVRRREFLLGSAAVLFSASCSSGNQTAGGGGTDGGAQQTLQFIQSGDANQGGGYAAMSKQYETETGVKIEVVEVPNADLPTKLKNAAQANDLPALARAGAVDPVWRDATIDLKSIADGNNVRKDLCAVDESGKVLSLPSDVTAVGLFLNKSLFTEAGVEYPTSESDIWSWDDCVAAIKQVQSKTGTSYGMVMDRSSHRLKAFLYEFGSTGFQPDAAGQFQTNAATKTALEYFKNLNDDKFMPRSVWLSNADGNALFKSGDVASYMSGSWQIADFAKNIKNFEWVSVYLPKQPVRATNFGNAASMVVFDGTGQEKEAQDFVNWLYKAENYTKLSETSGFLPAVEGLTIDYGANAAAFKIYQQEIAGTAPIASEIKQMELSYEVKGLATEGDPLRDETVKYLNDEQDVDTTIKNIGAQMTESLS